jgi:N-acetylmuramidase
MGMNYALAGFQSVEDMVAAMSVSENQQLAAVAHFLVERKLDRALQAHDWQSFALGYNGGNYKANLYDSKLLPRSRGTRRAVCPI